MNKKQEKLFRVIENYQKHIKELKNENSTILDMANKLCAIDIYEMWAITQVLMR